MTTAAIASKQRPTWLSKRLDEQRHLRAAIVFGCVAVAVALAVGFGTWQRAGDYLVATNLYVASAGLFIVALAIERLTELLVAPWVGSGDTRISRNVLVGSAALVLGVLIAGLTGLRLLTLLSGGDPADGALATAVDLLATGLAIGAGTKPLHDLITMSENRASNAKAAAASAGSPPAPEPCTTCATPAEVPDVPSGGSYRLALSIKLPAAGGDEARARAEEQRVRDTLRRLLPQWSVSPKPAAGSATRAAGSVTPAAGSSTSAAGSATMTAGPATMTAGPATPAIDGPVARSLLVHCTTPAVPGSPQFVQQQFSAAHRLHGAGLDVVISPSGMRSGAALTVAGSRRDALTLLGLDPATQSAARGGRGVRVAVLDTGYRSHPHGVDPDRLEFLPGADVLDGDPHATDPLASGPDWRDLDLVGAPGHGTGVAAVIAAGGRVELGRYTDEWWKHSPMLGVAPEATICPIRVMRGPVHLLDDDVAAGVKVATDANCDVISMSLGGLAFQGLAPAITKAVEAGTIVVCAAGNEIGVVVEPASYADTIAVASIGPGGQPYLAGSSRGPEVTVSAPGVQVLRPDFDPAQQPPEVLARGTGTTYATAHVAGIAALWLAEHGRDRLISAYGDARLIPRLFAYVLTATATRWDDPALAADWGPGSVNASAVLKERVIGDRGEAMVSRAALEAVFARKPSVAVSDRFAGAVAAVLTDDGTAKARGRVLGALTSAWRWLGGKAAGVTEQSAGQRQRAATTAGTLLGAELRAHAGANPNFRRALASATDEIPVPAEASPELRLVATETNREPGADMPADWGVGLSRPLKQALLGNGSMRRGFRSVGMIALAATVAAIWLFYDAGPDGAPGAVTTAIGALGIGLYGGAQAIERLLELTVGRWAFKNVPGREMDRALILLGIGIFLGALASITLDTGLLSLVAQTTPDDPWFHRADVLVTALAIGGGAKPLHDLMTRISVAKS